VGNALDAVSGFWSYTGAIAEAMAPSCVYINAAVIMRPICVASTVPVKIFSSMGVTVDAAVCPRSSASITDRAARPLIHECSAVITFPLIVTFTQALIVLSRVLHTEITMVHTRSITAIADFFALPYEYSTPIAAPAFLAFAKL
jgi:hypothetical protein